MKIQMLALAAALSMAAGSAFADEAAQATLKAPVSAPTHAVAGGATWSCEGTSCVTVTETLGDTFSVWSCKTLVQSVGPVSSYSLGGRALTPAQIDRCNKA
jgi:hypothetical protein